MNRESLMDELRAIRQHPVLTIVVVLFVAVIVKASVDGLRSLSPEVWTPWYWVREILLALTYAAGVLLCAFLASAAYVDTRNAGHQRPSFIATNVVLAAIVLPLATTEIYLRAFVFLLFLFGVPAAFGVRDWNRPPEKWLIPRREGHPRQYY